MAKFESSSTKAVVPMTQTTGITMQKYSRAWELFVTGHTIAEIQTAVGLSRPQMEWLVRIGDESQEMPSFTSRATEITARLRKNDIEISRIASEGAVEWVEHRRELAIQSTKLAKSLSSALGALMAKSIPTLADDQASEEALGRATMILKSTSAIRDALKALSPMTDYGPITDLTRAIFQDHQAAPSKHVAQNLGPESQMPASVALVEQVLGPQEASHDPLADLIPEWVSWTKEEQEEFVATGERPQRVVAALAPK